MICSRTYVWEREFLYKIQLTIHTTRFEKDNCLVKKNCFKENICRNLKKKQTQKFPKETVVERNKFYIEKYLRGKMIDEKNFL